MYTPTPTPAPGDVADPRDAVPAAGSLVGDTATKSVYYTLAGWQENLVQTGTANIAGNGNDAANVLIGNSGSNYLRGYAGNDALYGAAGADTLDGGAGDDRLSGGAGNDRLLGAAGQDRLTGGTGADRFVVWRTSESKVGAANRDIILDFNRAEGDKVDLSGIDANPWTSGDHAFIFIGTGAFTGRAGLLRVVKLASGVMLEGDLNGDWVGDFQVELAGVTDVLASDIIA